MVGKPSKVVAIAQFRQLAGEEATKAARGDIDSRGCY